MGDVACIQAPSGEPAVGALLQLIPEDVSLLSIEKTNFLLYTDDHGVRWLVSGPYCEEHREELKSILRREGVTETRSITLEEYQEIMEGINQMPNRERRG